MPAGSPTRTVRIKLDDKVVYEKTHVRSGQISPVIYQDLKGAKTLTLEVDGGRVIPRTRSTGSSPHCSSRSRQRPTHELDDLDRYAAGGANVGEIRRNKKGTGARRNTGPSRGCPTIMVGDPQPDCGIGASLSISEKFLITRIRVMFPLSQAVLENGFGGSVYTTSAELSKRPAPL